MKNRYWLLPALLLISSWPYSFICAQLPRSNKLLPVIVTLFLFALIGLILSRTCTRRTALISSAGLMIFCLVLTGLDLLVPLLPGLRETGMMLLYLWQILFYPFLRVLPALNTPFLHYLFPALIPFAWVLFCKPSP